MVLPGNFRNYCKKYKLDYKILMEKVASIIGVTFFMQKFTLIFDLDFSFFYGGKTYEKDI